MSKFVHADVLDNGPALIKSACTKMLLLSSYAFGASYAAVQAAKLAEVTMSPGDFTLGTDANNRTLSVAPGKTATLAVAATGTDSHIAFTDGSARVLWVTDDTANPTGNAGATVNFPGVIYTVQQPT